jgi:hypothetical protein
MPVSNSTQAVDFLPKSLPIADVLREIKIPEPYVACVTGSLVEGFGHAESDVDVYVLSEDVETMKKVFPQFTNRFIDVLYVGETRVDYEYWGLQTVRSIIASIEESSFQNSDSADCLNSVQLKLLHNLRIARPLANSAGFDELIRGLDANKLAAVLHWQNYATFLGYAEDTTGLLTSGDLHSALLSAELALNHSVDCYLARKGDTNPGAKWRFRKLRRLGLDSLHQRYWNVKAAQITEANLRQRVEQMLEMAHELAIEAQSE